MTNAEKAIEAKKQFDFIRQFRFELTEREGMGLPDRQFDDELLTYRQALRDLPETCKDTMTLDENEVLTGVDWPNIPLRYFVPYEGAKKEHPK